MFQCVDVLLSFEATIVLSDALSLKVNGNRFRTGLYRNFSATVFGGNGVVVRIETNGSKTIHTTAGAFARVKWVSGERIQLELFLSQHGSNIGFFATNLVR